MSTAYTLYLRARPVTIVQDETTTTRVYDDSGALLSESYPRGPLDGLGLTNTCDQWLRRTNLTLNTSPSALSQSFTYDAASRLFTVAEGTTTAEYAYLTNSPLVEQITFKQNGQLRMTTSKTYDNLNRLTGIETLNAQPSTLNSHAYQPNAAN